VHKDHVVSFSMCVAHFGEGVADLDVLYLTALLSAVDAFLEPEDVALKDIKIRRGFYIYFFLKISIKTGGLNVHLVYFKVMFSSEGKDGIEGREFGNWCEGLVEIDAFNLSETLCNDAFFVLLYAAVGSMFDIENPFAAYNFVAFWPGDNIVNI